MTTKIESLTVCCAAQLIGFDIVRTYEELPAGFRINWEQAEEAGAFRDCHTIGDFKLAYLQHLIKRSFQRAA